MSDRDPAVGAGKKKEKKRKYSISTGWATVLAACILAAGGLVGAKIQRVIDPQHVAPTTTFGEAMPRGDNADVSATEGFIAQGTVEDMPLGDTIWLLTKDDGSFAVYGEASISGERWEFVAESVEGSGVPFDVRAVVIWAKPDYANSLRDRVSRHDVTFVILPGGCREGPTFDVSVTHN